MKGDKEKRLEERDKRLAEAERRKAEAMSKMAGKLIEDVEKDRLKPKVKSLIARITAHIENIGTNARFSRDLVEGTAPPDVVLHSGEINLANICIETYNSIRYDFKETLKISEEKLAKLFPKRDIKFRGRQQLINMYNRILEQEKQMMLYLNRIIS